MPNVLITGSSRGIGAAAARLFAREGWGVALNSSSPAGAVPLARELSGLGVTAAAIQADVSVPEQAERLVQEAEAALGCLDAVVCNAGMALPLTCYSTWESGPCTLPGQHSSLPWWRRHG